MQSPPSAGETAAAAPIDAAPATESRGAPAPADPPAVKAASLSPRARKAAAEKKATPKKPATGAKGAKRGFVHKPKGPDLQEDLRAFVTARPSGWGHEDWIAFLGYLRERGHDTSDPGAI